MITTKPFDPTKPYRTRDGREAKIVHTWKDGTLLVVVDDYHYTANPDGRAYDTPFYDLVNIPAKKTIEFWVKIHRDGFSTSERQPEKDNATEILHIVREYEEGEGLA